jgi:pimeloyl-ACP methyl ester carboxylesterase
MSEARDRLIESGDATIHFLDRGPVDGDPVMLVHGWPDSSRLWRHQLDPLTEAGHRVLVPDLRGFGASSAPADRSAYGMSSVVGDLVAVMADAGAERVHLVGHDWGAAVAWTVARHLPHALASLTVLSVGHPAVFWAGGAGQRERSWYMLAFLHEGLAEDLLTRDEWAGLREVTGHHPEADRWVTDLGRPGRLTASLDMYRKNLPAEVLLGRPSDPTPVAVDTMGVWSTGDRFLLREQMVASAGHVEGQWRYEEVEASHWIPLDAPDHLSRLLLDWVALPRAR